MEPWQRRVATAAAALVGVGVVAGLDADVGSSLSRCDKNYYQDKVVWITGASSGIGAELARQLAALNVGVKIILSSRSTEPLENLAEQLKGAETAVVACDLGDLDSLEDVASKALASFGRIDILVNNGGISTRAFAEDADFSVDTKVMTVDFLSYAKLTKLVLPGMIERKSGHIVNTSSLAGKIGTPMRTAYSAAKFAIIGHFDALRLELAPHNIHVTNICPGSVRTNVARNAVTTTADRKFNGADKNIDNGMKVERCAELYLATISSCRYEVWMFGSAREKIFAYLATYMPGTFRNITVAKAPKLMADAREIMKNQSE
mmetsp:Transcript_17524/g.34445  ORF Transcript_17524/g.34445 Transcript_17524/m.34445 type:complete len:319 (-) Transcript_17524:189-1145(-)